MIAGDMEVSINKSNDSLMESKIKVTNPASVLSKSQVFQPSTLTID